MPAALLKDMVLSLLQGEETGEPMDIRPRKSKRSRTPSNMKSPLEQAKDNKKGKSKYDKAYNQRKRKDTLKDNEAARALEQFGKSDELA